VPTLKAEWKKICKLNTELVEAVLAFGRFHNKDNYGTPAKQAMSRKRLIKAMDAMYEYLEGERVVKITTPSPVTTYETEGKLVHIINLEK
jgi:hypothetical protein